MANTATAAKTATGPNVGDRAPEFSLPADGGRSISLSEFKGKSNVVLYFYPKDDTPGCTLEAKDFAANISQFTRRDTAIIGVSKDDVKSHDKFKEKYCLPFPLASDETGKICEAYGVWTQKSMYGKTYMGIERSTFLIDKSGIIRNAWRKVKVEGHTQEVLNAIDAL